MVGEWCERLFGFCLLITKAYSLDILDGTDYLDQFQSDLKDQFELEMVLGTMQAFPNPGMGKIWESFPKLRRAFSFVCRTY